MKGITVYYEKGGKFSIMQARLKDVMNTDGRANPLVWFSICLDCQDYVVCGLSTKTETLEITRQHMKEHKGNK